MSADLTKTPAPTAGDDGAGSGDGTAAGTAATPAPGPSDRAALTNGLAAHLAGLRAVGYDDEREASAWIIWAQGFDDRDFEALAADIVDYLTADPDSDPWSQTHEARCEAAKVLGPLAPDLTLAHAVMAACQHSFEQGAAHAIAQVTDALGPEVLDPVEHVGETEEVQP